MRNFIFQTVAMIVIAVPLVSRADDLSADEKKFFDGHISAVVKIEPKRLADPAVLKVFSAPFYEVKINITQGDGTETSSVIVARVGEQLVSIARPSSDADMPDFQKMLDPKFKLATDEDAKTLQAALDVTYPIPSFSDKDLKAKAFRHSGTTWSFIRGEFFDKHMGYVVETDAAGKVTSVKYSLKLP